MRMMDARVYAASRMVVWIALAGAAMLVSARGVSAQLPEDGKAQQLEANITNLARVACTSTTDSETTVLKTSLANYATQLQTVLTAQRDALRAGQVAGLPLGEHARLALAAALDNDIAALKNSAASQDPCPLGSRFGSGAPFVAAALPSSPADNLEITPSIVRVGEKEVSDHAEASVTIKNTGKDSVVRLGVTRVCLHDKSTCLEQGEIFQVADGTDKCKNPLAPSDQCSLKILFTPKRAYNYNHWLQVPLVGPDGQPLKQADGTTLVPPLMISLQGTGFVANMARVEATGPSGTHPSLRSVVGTDIGGATSTDVQQQVFVDFAINAPIGLSGYTACLNAKGEELTDQHGKVKAGDKKDTFVRSYGDCQNLMSEQEKEDHVRYVWKDYHSDPLQSRAWWFFNPRITSIPQQASALSSLNVQGFTDNLTGQKTSLVQGIDVQGGVEIMLVKPRAGRAFFGSFKNTKSRLGLAWVTGGGFASPFAAPGSNPTVFTLASGSPLRHQFQTPDPTCTTAPCMLVDIPQSFTNITFVNQERSRFFRRYYSGLRFKTYHFSRAFQSADCDPGYSNECEGVYNTYPGVLDLTVGQDEQVSGGHLSRWLLRLDVAYPLPFVPGLYVFGGVSSLFQKNQTSDPVFMPGTSTTAISDPSVFQVKVPLRNRDAYRLGLGVDLLQVIQRAQQSGSKNQAGSGTSAATANP